MDEAFVALCKRFIALKARREELEAELEKVKEEADSIREPIIRRMQESGVTKVTADGRTVYLRRELWAKAPAGKEEAIAALRAAGLDQFVYETFNTNSLSAWVRQQPEDPATHLPGLPPELDGKVAVEEVYDIRVVRS